MHIHMYVYTYTQTDRDTVQCEPQSNMWVTSVSIHVRTDIASHIHICCVASCRSICIEYCRWDTHWSIILHICIVYENWWYYIRHLHHLLCDGVLSTIIYTIQHNAIWLMRGKIWTTMACAFVGDGGWKHATFQCSQKDWWGWKHASSCIPAVSDAMDC